MCKPFAMKVLSIVTKNFLFFGQIVSPSHVEYLFLAFDGDGDSGAVPLLSVVSVVTCQLNWKDRKAIN